ncbi:MAG: sulfurtransferase, partial [Campylobacterales bacterium]|nr:sulfurtransferase [Campylobacterales bacterium]
MRKWLKAIVTASLISTIQASAVEIGDVLISADEAVKLIGKPDVMFVTGDSHDIFELGHIKGSVEMYAHHLHHADITGHMHCAPLFMCPDEAEKYIGSKGI